MSSAPSERYVTSTTRITPPHSVHFSGATGVHASVDGRHSTFANRFPFVIWYGVRADVAIVYAVLDGRREPAENDAILRNRQIEPEGGY